MSDLRNLLEFRSGQFTRGEMFASPAVQAAYKTLLDGDAEGAAARFTRILQDSPRDHEAMAGLAVCMAEMGGKFMTAEKLARKAVRLGRNSAAGYIALGYIHLRGSRLDEGYRYLMKAKHLAPRDPRIEAGFAIYDQERPPVIADLSRLHPVNRVLGGVRAQLRSPVHRAAALVFVVTSVYLAGNLMI